MRKGSFSPQCSRTVGVMSLSVPALSHSGQESRTVAVLYRSNPCKAIKEGNKDGIESSIVSAVDGVGGITSAIESEVKGISPVLGIRALGLNGFEGGTFFFMLLGIECFFDRASSKKEEGPLFANGSPSRNKRA